MSRLFGAIRQNGYVVRDINAAMDHWIEVMGVGPWFCFDRVKIDWFRHRGAGREPRGEYSAGEFRRPPDRTDPASE